MGLDPARLAGTQDRWLRTIVTGKPGMPGVKPAPDLGKFSVPKSRVAHPRLSNLMSLRETEVLFWGDDLVKFLEEWQPNPYLKK